MAVADDQRALGERLYAALWQQEKDRSDPAAWVVGVRAWYDILSARDYSNWYLVQAPMPGEPPRLLGMPIRRDRLVHENTIELRDRNDRVLARITTDKGTL